MILNNSMEAAEAEGSELPEDSQEEMVKRMRQDSGELRRQLGAMTCKYEALVQKLRDKVWCPVCFKVPRSAPVPVCPNGHVVCSSCEWQVCPICRRAMEGGRSLLALTVVENIEHECGHEGCSTTLPLPALPQHEAECERRPVKCPSLDCGAVVSLAGLLTHVRLCCFIKQVRSYSLPHSFHYMMNESVEELAGDRKNFNWKLEALRFDGRLFFLKVTRKARSGRWYVFLQLGERKEAAMQYRVSVTLGRPRSLTGVGSSYAGDAFSQTYMGDLCPIDVASVEEAEDRGLCLAVKDGGMQKFFVRNRDTGENEFSVTVNIFKKL